MRLERIITVVVVIMVGLGLTLLVERAPTVLPLPGGLLGVSLVWIIVALLLVVAALGVEATVHAHPHTHLWPFPRLHLGKLTLEFAPRYWTLPALLTLGAALFLRIFANDAIVALILVITAIALTLVFIAQYHSLDAQDKYFGVATLGLNIIAYLAAFALFGSIYYAKERSLVSAPTVLAVAALLSYEIFTRSSGLGYGVLGTGVGRFAPEAANALRSRALVLAISAGLLLGEVTWALNYWPVSALVGGMFLLLSFYIVVGLMSLYLTGGLNGRAVVEFTLVGISGMIIVFLISFTNRQ
ncbi:MAG: hypothetical protein DLM69_11285 [Candidatus Chloroheliales bacterium]|nr:MAG: hypothetical protein DLM69_11285 [Chloroflexota bacterium]